MRRRWMLLALGGAAVIALAATLAESADTQPMAVVDLTGGLRIQQSVPCADDIDQTTPISAGRLELAPSEGIPVTGGGRYFTLTRADVSFASFTISRSCFGFGETRTYTSTRVQLVRPVSFTAAPTSSPGVYAVTIARDNFYFYYATVVNGKLEVAYKFPSQDVTGTIDLAAGTMQMQAVMATRVHFKVCVEYIGCPVDEWRNGTLTATINGTIQFPDADGDGVPDRSDNCRFVANPTQATVATPTIAAPADVTLTSCLDHSLGVARAADVCDGTGVTVSNDAPALFRPGPNTVTWTARDGFGRSGTDTQTVTINDTTPPTVTCTALNPIGSSFRVSATDVCTQSPVIRLGSYVLAEGETLMINETGQTGVRLQNTLAGGVRHFQVGRGEAVITATDESGNVATVACTVPR
jgi:thrombospondin type 3 repeat protein